MAIDIRRRWLISALFGAARIASALAFTAGFTMRGAAIGLGIVLVERNRAATFRDLLIQIDV